MAINALTETLLGPLWKGKTKTKQEPFSLQSCKILIGNDSKVKIWGHGPPRFFLINQPCLNWGGGQIMPTILLLDPPRIFRPSHSSDYVYQSLIKFDFIFYVPATVFNRHLSASSCNFPFRIHAQFWMTMILKTKNGGHGPPRFFFWSFNPASTGGWGADYVQHITTCPPPPDF